jgi:hypothetical protein
MESKAQRLAMISAIALAFCGLALAAGRDMFTAIFAAQGCIARNDQASA